MYSKLFVSVKSRRGQAHAQNPLEHTDDNTRGPQVVASYFSPMFFSSVALTSVLNYFYKVVCLVVGT